ncbi:hypothetical protein KY290_008132 [Solanum tuberosum]|uniref:Retrotransposon gag domain-containing protein n=1 Tax=Solanum tuberosum TaxID=4113 RepID=A0ABQ7W7H4_SOLTU|nr:hypothetical protein KY290_008132 [Solanum tuberosum]
MKQETPQVQTDPMTELVTNAEFRVNFQVLAQAMTTQANREIVVSMNPNMGTAASRVREFTRMNRPKFHGSKVEEDPQEFIDEVYKVLMIMGVTPVEKFKVTFLDRLFSLEMREAKLLELFNLLQGNMSVKEYSLKFTQLSRYALTMVADSRAMMKEKLKEKSREAKKAMTDDGSSNAPPKLNKDRVSNPKPQGGNSGGFSSSTCAKCGRKHEGKSLAGTDDCFGYGKSGHKIRDCQSLTTKKREGMHSRLVMSKRVLPMWLLISMLSLVWIGCILFMLLLIVKPE